MAPLSPLVLVLRAVPSASFKRLVSRCRPLWNILWHLLQRCFLFLSERQHSGTSPPQRDSYETLEENKQRCSRAEVGSAGSTRILASLLPTDRLQLPPLASSGISWNVIPPEDDAASVTSSQFERMSSIGDLMAIHPGNDMSSQIFKVLSTRENTSRTSLVLPASPCLAPGRDDLGPGASRDTSFFQGISDYIYPLLPYKVPRYKRKRFIEDKYVEFEIAANRGDFSLGDLPKGWQQVTHPGGQPYFYHAEKKIITECWIWDHQMFLILDDFINQFKDFTRSRNLTQPSDVHLLLEVNIEDGVNWCGYYYVSTSTQSLFWLEPFDISNHVSEVRGDISSTHIKLYLEYQYWFHWDLFPNIFNATDDTYDLVSNTIADARTEVQSSRNSTVNLSKEELKEMAEIVEGMKNHKASASHWCLGRFMQALLKDRFLNYHGQYGARLKASSSIHNDEVLRPRFLFRISSLLLFSAPNIHLRNLNELWVDKITIRPRWVKYYVDMNEQWGEHIFHASILLNANVAFLSIPSNDPSNDSTFLRSARTGAQLSSYLSIVTSFSSMLLGLMLVLKHRAKERDISERKLDVNKHHEYLHEHFSPKNGFGGLAIMYSLPFALLIWGTVSFFVAFLLMCLVKSTAGVRSVVGIAAALVCGLIFWCIYIFWFRKISKNMWNRLTARGNDEKEKNSEITPNQDNDQVEGESRNDNADSTFHGWMVSVKSWLGGRWRVLSLRGNATSTGNNMPRSPV